VSEQTVREETTTTASRGVQRFAPLAVALVLIVGALVLLNGGDLFGLGIGAASEKPEIGSRAPDFELTALDGQNLRLSSLRGKPVLINFWATWCAPCRAEMPALDQAQRTHAEQGLTVLAVDVQEGPVLVRGFIDEMGLGLNPLLDTTSDVSATYRTIGLPISFFVDRNGIIRDIVIGGMTEQMIQTKLQKIL